MDIRYDRYSMIIDGQRTLIRSGAMHYFRLPSPDLWRDRLLKLKAAGYNTVDLYFCWAYHSPEPGVYNFEGIRDVNLLLEIAQELGLWVIARPGPYINAEYTAGGLPGWLLTNPEVTLRNRKRDGSFCWSDKYMQYVREWWEQIVPIVNRFPNILMMQIENEYATLEMEPDYMQALYQMTRDLGVTVPLSHNDLYACGLYEDIVDIYAFDNYSVTHFETKWHGVPEVFSVLDNVEESMRPYCVNRPLMVAELQAGWFGGWKGISYQTIIESLGRAHIGVTTKTLLAQGLTIFNHYKLIGGTNWGYIGSTDTYTSYDFAAPISEAGVNTERLYEAKALNLFLQSFSLAATDRTDSLEIEVTDPDTLIAVRHNVENPEEHWLFFRNLGLEPIHTTLDANIPIHLNPSEMLILPYHIRLLSGDILVKSSVEPVYQTENYLVMKADRPVSIQLAMAAGLPVLVQEGIAEVKTEGNRYHISCPTLLHNGWEELRIGSYVIYLLGQHRVDTLWQQDNGSLISGVDAYLGGNHCHLSDPKETVLIIAPHGNLTREKGFEVIEHPELPVLKHWTSGHEAPQLYESHGFIPLINGQGDFDTNKLYEGSAWYRYSFELSDLTTGNLTIDARHIWSVFLNGHPVGHGHHWISVQGDNPPAPVRLTLPQECMQDNQPNELVIFVDGLGHPKGFHDDAALAQGLLQLELDGRDLLPDTLFYGGLARWQAPIRELLGTLPDRAPLVHFQTQFKFRPPEGLEIPLGLRIKDLDYERINIYLNGTLLGRSWRECLNQTLFYLPPGILKTNNEENQLELIVMNFDPLVSRHNVPTPEQVFFEPYGVFTQVEI